MDNNDNYSYLKFTYNNPVEDMHLVKGLNIDGTINIKYSLYALKQKLMENVKYIDKLLEVSNQINNILIDGEDILVTIESDTVKKSMLALKLITLDSNVDEQNLNEQIYQELYEQNEETNTDRCKKIMNLSNMNRLKPLFTNEQREDSESENEIISDDKNFDAIAETYYTYINSNRHKYYEKSETDKNEEFETDENEYPFDDEYESDDNIIIRY
uniref:Uncharacterized protein n=1 Tax=viral metagenome TaxID=1070528 RepID=A0A6C0LR88_9ZZZZ